MRLKSSISGWADCNGDGRRRAGGLSLLWDEDVEIEKLSYSQNHIDATVKDIMDENTW